MIHSIHRGASCDSFPGLTQYDFAGQALLTEKQFFSPGPLNSGSLPKV